MSEKAESKDRPETPPKTSVVTPRITREPGPAPAPRALTRPKGFGVAVVNDAVQMNGEEMSAEAAARLGSALLAAAKKARA